MPMYNYVKPTGLLRLTLKICTYSFSIITTAFFATCLIFLCFTLSALWAEERSFLYLGGNELIIFIDKH